MKQLLVLSGKGGTGKTTVAATLIKLFNAKAFADCDVDAPNLHLLFNQDHKAELADFYGMPKAEINKDLCTSCGLCAEHCRFNAIDASYSVDPFSCEGCELCKAICPSKAIHMIPAVTGELQTYKDDNRIFSTARLKMGSGNSGKLVTEVKKQLSPVKETANLAIVDGSPGIGCPVIASLSGVDLVLLVAEPSISGISDLKRILDTTEIFKVPVAVCINKYDTSLDKTSEIETLCSELGLPLVGKIPFDREVLKATNRGETLENKDNPAGKAIREIHQALIPLLQ